MISTISQVFLLLLYIFLTCWSIISICSVLKEWVIHLEMRIISQFLSVETNQKGDERKNLVMLVKRDTHIYICIQGPFNLDYWVLPYIFLIQLFCYLAGNIFSWEYLIGSGKIEGFILILHLFCKTKVYFKV